MVKSGESKLKFFISLIVIITLLHLTAHFMIYGTGISLFAEKGISGLAIGALEINEDELQDFKSSKPQTEKFSKFLILGEWLFLISLIMFMFIKEKMSIKQELIDLNIKDKYKGAGKTDIDVFYEILKEKKSLRVSTVAKIFSVNKSLVMEWIDTLESGNLAYIDYPRFGEPTININ